MTEINNTEELTEEKQVLSFGEHLYIERKKQNISVSEAASAIHLSEKIIDAIERSDISQLPQPTFVKGYLKAYAKYLDVSESLVLEEYAQAVPHMQETELLPRAPSPDDMNSDSPIVKMVTIFLLVIMVAAAIYASFSYYKNAIVTDEVEIVADVNESKNYTLSSEDELDSKMPVTIDAEINTEADLTDLSVVGYNAPSVSHEPVGIDVDIERGSEPKKVEVKGDVKMSELLTDAVEPIPSQVVQDNTANQRVINQFVVAGDDSLEIVTIQASWVEVDDTNSENLYYGLLQPGRQIVLTGVAPFKVFLGNAPQVNIKLNDIVVNIEKKYIRSNNIAHFNISVDQQQIVIH